MGLGEVERERESSWDSMLEFLDLTDTETDAPSVVMMEAEVFCRAAFLRRSVTVAEGADLSFLGSLGLGDLGDLIALRELDLPPLEGMLRRRRLAVVELGEDCRQLD